ncbi:unnamed protein product, partial [Rangifer tarandus platyrhynchus]
MSAGLTPLDTDIISFSLSLVPSLPPLWWLQMILPIGSSSLGKPMLFNAFRVWRKAN